MYIYIYYCNIYLDYGCQIEKIKSKNHVLYTYLKIQKNQCSRSLGGNMHPTPGHASERIAPNQRRWPVHSCAKGDSKCIGFPAWKCQSIYSKDSKVLAPKNSGSIAKKAFCGVLSNSGSMQIITRHLLSEFLHHHHPPLRQATHTTSPEGKSVHGHLPIHVAAIPSAKHPRGWVHF